MDELHDKHQRLIAAARDGSPALTVVAHPCDETSLRGAMEAAAAHLIEPVLVGPEARIRAIAASGLPRSWAPVTTGKGSAPWVCP